MFCYSTNFSIFSKHFKFSKVKEFAFLKTVLNISKITFTKITVKVPDIMSTEYVDRLLPVFLKHGLS